MKKTLYLFVVILLASVIRLYAYDDHDFQVWNTDYEEFKVNDRTKVVLEEEFRWGNNARQLFYQHYDLGVFHELFKWLNAGGGYRQIYDLVGGSFEPCYEPYLAATLLGNFKGFKIDDRNRMEYNDFDYKIDFWRYRNKLTVKFPWKFTKMEIQPYVSDEIFLVFGQVSTQFNQNRFSAGFDMNMLKNCKIGLYYMLQSFKSSGTWKDANVLGTKIKVSF